MCRIFGISYHGEEECIGTAKIARLLYRELVHGGPHAWGYMRFDGENVWTHREPGRADTKAALDTVTQHLRGKDSRWFCGHVRYATHGKPEQNQNNHPLHHGNIIGVHNGVLDNHDDILKVTGREDASVEVDSEAIFAAVNKWGHAPGLRKIVGDMVTVYVDLRKPHLVHIGRSYGRSLAIGWTDRGNILWASERSALTRLEGFGMKFEGLSAVREMRHLVVRDGQIIYRHTYGKVPEHHTETSPTPAPARWPVRERILTTPHWFDSKPIDLDEVIADRHRPRTSLDVPTLEELDAHEHLYGQKVDEDTYYYHGRLMTADEYVETLAEEMEWEWE